MYRKLRPLNCIALTTLTVLVCLLYTGHGMAMPKASTMQNGPTVSGTVLETMSASGYTYMLVESASGQNWVAIPETSITKGATVTYHQGMTMKDFTSKTLNRTFDSVIFSSGLTDGSEKTAPAPTPTADDSFAAAVKAEQIPTGSAAAPLAASGGSSGAVVPLKEITIEKSTAANGYTVGEIFAKAKELSGTKVQIRAKVVKFNPLIMGKNWIHLQDGTGDPMQNSHDLVVTSNTTTEVDSVIVVEGILAAEKDFGAGYKYAAIIEDAQIIE